MTQPDVVEELRAEVERLNKEGSNLAAIIRQQGLEIERLREALQDIIDQGETVCLWDAQQIARAALEPKP